MFYVTSHTGSLGLGRLFDEISAPGSSLDQLSLDPLVVGFIVFGLVSSVAICNWRLSLMNDYRALAVWIRVQNSLQINVMILAFMRVANDK